MWWLVVLCYLNRLLISQFLHDLTQSFCILCIRSEIIMKSSEECNGYSDSSMEDSVSSRMAFTFFCEMRFNMVIIITT